MTKTALITGGARGVGLEIALNLARDHNVCATWLTTRPDALPPEIVPIQADLREPEACKAVIAATMRRFGRLDVIVNNAGVVEPTPIDAFDPASARAMFDVNLLAPSALLAAALPHLRQGASIVNVSSVNAALPPAGASIYGATKAALNLWTRAMAKELGPRRIRVNAVAPGAVENAAEPRPAALTQRFVEETALGRIGHPRDIARAVRFLAGDEAGFITGEVLTVSGGYRL